MSLMPSHYNDAVFAQDASNLSGVLHAFDRAMTEMSNEGLDSKQRARHPITVLYLDKLVQLAGGYVEWHDEIYGSDTYGYALRTCRERANQDVSQSVS